MNPQNDNPLPFPDLDLIFVEGGTFTMGDEVGDLRHACWPLHEVKVSSFYIGKFQVTQRLWESVKGPHYIPVPKGENHPMVEVSRNDAKNFIDKLNGINKVQKFIKELTPSGAYFRLPTEAEWEFAARGGIYSENYLYAGSDDLNQVGWYNGNSKNILQDVGLLRPNELGIFDMSGNVWEWCEDGFHKDYNGAPNDGSAWIDNLEKGGRRVLRGGSYYHEALDCRLANRLRFSPDISYVYHGLRLVVSL